MATSESEVEILRIVRSIRDTVGLLPDRVADQVADRLRATAPSAPDQTAKAEPPKETTSDGTASAPETSEEVVSAQVELAEITQQRDKAQSDLDTLVGKLKVNEQRFEATQEAIESALAEATKAKTHKDTIEAEVARLHADAETVCEEIEKLTIKRQELETDFKEAQKILSEAQPIKKQSEDIESKLAELETRRAEFEDHRRLGESAHLLLERFWPEWLRTGTLAEWKSRIEAGVFEASSPPSFGLLFAAVHTYNAALRDSDPKTLHDSLRDLGRRLYAWLRDLDRSDADSASIAEQWAKAINGDCAGRGEIEVPIPGNAANNQWMLFQPRGGSSPDVASVRSWCVRDAQKRPVHRAEVTV